MGRATAGTSMTDAEGVARSERAEIAVLVSGASSGIGRAFCEFLAKQKADPGQLRWMVFAGVRSQRDFDALLKTTGVTPVLLDVTDAASIAQAIEFIKGTGIPLGAVVNNAGIALAGPAEFMPLEDVERSWKVNVMGTLALTQSALPLMRLAREKYPHWPVRIINVSSTAGFFSLPLMSAYSMSKFALESLSDALRQELKPWQIDVVVVEPGNIKTPIWEKSAREADQISGKLPPKAYEYYGQLIGAARKLAEKAYKEASSVDVVTKVLWTALRAKRPLTRYRVGHSAVAEYLISRCLSDRLADRIVASQFK